MDRILQVCKYRKALAESNRVNDETKHIDQVSRDQARGKRGAAEGIDRSPVLCLQALDVGDQVLPSHDRMQPTLQHGRIDTTLLDRGPCLLHAGRRDNTATRENRFRYFVQRAREGTGRGWPEIG